MGTWETRARRAIVIQPARALLRQGLARWARGYDEQMGTGQYVGHNGQCVQGIGGRSKIAGQ